MEKLTWIVLDTKGADKGTETLVKGAKLAMETYENLAFVLSGDKEKLEALCSELSIDLSRVEILDAPGEITNYDSPTQALFEKRDSSMVRGLETLAQREDLFGIITAGNTGALLAGAMRNLSGADRVRPAMAAILPAANGGFTCLVDTGATIDCTPAMLHHFAKLGRDFMMRMYGIENPRIGLLSNGAEPTKGNKLVKETHVILAEDSSLNFVGNVEGNVALSGCCDVLVCDGFAGNQVLKVTEGTATRIMTDIMKYAHKTQNPEIKKLAGYLLGIYDIAALGGGIVLGISKPVIKARGSADERSVVSTAGMLLNMAENKAVFDQSKNHI